MMAVFIDGVALAPEALERAIRLSATDGIEVYASTSAVPVQYRHGSAERGPILIR